MLGWSPGGSDIGRLMSRSRGADHWMPEFLISSMDLAFELPSVTLANFYRSDGGSTEVPFPTTKRKSFWPGIRFAADGSVKTSKSCCERARLAGLSQACVLSN